MSPSVLSRQRSGVYWASFSEETVSLPRNGFGGVQVGMVFPGALGVVLGRSCGPEIAIAAALLHIARKTLLSSFPNMFES